jgi:8-oxo-dGTP pyrophosphatase MutT (NUDIX family)
MRILFRFVRSLRSVGNGDTQISAFDQGDPPVFSNRPNQPVAVSGRTIFLSRSVAVMGVVVFHNTLTDELFVAVALRGKRVSNSGLWSTPCGYLDWEESLQEALLREVWEEIGLDLRRLESYGFCTVPEAPIGFQDDPTKDAHQNITHRFLVVISMPVAPPLSSAHADEDEVDEVIWLPYTEDGVRSLQFAFHHDGILLELLPLVRRMVVPTIGDFIEEFGDVIRQIGTLARKAFRTVIKSK